MPLLKKASNDAATIALEQLTHALQHPAPTAPFTTLLPAHLTAIQDIHNILTVRVYKAPHSDLPRVPGNISRPEPTAASTAAPRSTVASAPAPVPGAPPPRVPMHDSTQQATVTTIYTQEPVSRNTRHFNTRRPSYQQQLVLSVIEQSTGRSCEYKQLITGTVDGHDKSAWEHSFANEIGRLAQGVGTRMTNGTDTIKFIPRNQLPTGRKATYGRIVVSVRPQKAEPLRTRLTVGGNLIDYPHDKSTPTADITTAKILFNAVLSTPNAKFVTLDIKDFYLNTYMPQHKYMQLPLIILPAEIITQYNLLQIAHNGIVFVEICKGMYGLPQAGKLANEQLQEHLAKHGYRQTKATPGLWAHDTKQLKFSLVVDDFGILYVDDDDLLHLLAALQTKYKITQDLSGALYCGLLLQWDYDKQTVNLSMPGYIEAALNKFSHNKPIKPQHSSHASMLTIYGQK